MKKMKNKKPETGKLGLKTGNTGLGTSKGQAMMEYLLTYGLALFVIVIVLAILVTVVLPALKPPELCQFQQPGFSCNQKQAAIVSTGGAVSVIAQLDNQQGRDIKVAKVACLNEAVGNVKKEHVDDNGVVGQPLTAGSNAVFKMPCKNPDDKIQTILGANANFKGSIGVIYNYVDDVKDAPPRLAVATITGTTQAG